ncbi:MAG: hypothetical protein ACRCXZ_10190 [Patescibacteria group bacterium]
MEIGAGVVRVPQNIEQDLLARNRAQIRAGQFYNPKKELQAAAIERTVNDMYGHNITEAENKLTQLKEDYKRTTSRKKRKN